MTIKTDFLIRDAGIHEFDEIGKLMVDYSAKLSRPPVPDFAEKFNKLAVKLRTDF